MMKEIPVDRLEADIREIKAILLDIAAPVSLSPAHG
jgi:hypothetical protein